jgi:hypothetical protein
VYKYSTSGLGPGYVYFGGRLISGPNGPVVTDRLGSQRYGMAYYPWERRNLDAGPASQIRDLFPRHARPGLCGLALLHSDRGEVLYAGQRRAERG